MTMKTTFNAFSGSYPLADVTFLLSLAELDYLSVEKKEQLIQSGKKHYSEMLSKESAPSPAHMALYQNAMIIFGERLATEVVALAKGLIEQVTTRPIVLVSLVRAGVPLAVCLLHALKDLGVEAIHYGISIIRDRGIDQTALNFILEQHSPESIVFVDGWTGKGAISRELTKSLECTNVLPRLVVLADPCGMAWLSSSEDDWLIPFGILGAPVAGLISRSLWRDKGLHAIVMCEHLGEHDISNHFIKAVDQIRVSLDERLIAPAQPNPAKKEQQQITQELMTTIAARYNIDSLNRIKPGIAEATRAVMRRVPEHILVNNMDDPDIKLLIHLAEKANVSVEEVKQDTGIYRAITIIKKVI